MAHPDLLAHRAQFEKSITRLGDGIYTAVGYAASNVHMIEGDSSITIIDTSESTKAAENILAEFQRLSDKPIARIIYTHSHRDHISGATVFAEGRDVPILAHLGFKSDLVAVSDTIPAPNMALGRRTQAQFGIGLSGEERVSLGCGPGDRPMQGLGAGFLPPTQVIEAECDIDLDGVQARLIFAPGETADHMMVWLPEQRILFPGDNWYYSFPNLYAIRGTAYRDFIAWANSLDLIAGLGVEVMAPGHTNPVFGADQVQEVVTSTRDAIMHVVSHTAAGMNAGQSMDDIAATISLPDHLLDKPWLGEFYGKLSWSARAYAVGTLGWYDGNPTHLGGLSSRVRAEKIAAISGGIEGLWDVLKNDDDPQWKLEICDHLIALDQPAEAQKAALLKHLAETEINATARNTYLWEAKQLLSRISEGSDT